MAGLIAALVIEGVSSLKEYCEENDRIEYIRQELKDFKKGSDDGLDMQMIRRSDGTVYRRFADYTDALRKSDDRDGIDVEDNFSEEFIRRQDYKYMRRRIKPVSDRLSPDKQLELNRALDFDYKNSKVLSKDLKSIHDVEGEWPTDMRKKQSDQIFEKLEGLEWLKLNK